MGDEEKKIGENLEQEVQIAIRGDMILCKSPGVTVREEMEEDGRYILFNAENELILVINSTGKLILDNCDGKRTVGNIIEHIEEKFTIKDDIDLDSVVREYIGTLFKAGLVEIKDKGRWHEA